MFMTRAECYLVSSQSHLDRIADWYVLGILVDTHIGVLDVVDKQKERDAIIAAGRKLLIRIEAPLDSQPEDEAELRVEGGDSFEDLVSLAPDLNESEDLWAFMKGMRNVVYRRNLKKKRWFLENPGLVQRLLEDLFCALMMPIAFPYHIIRKSWRPREIAYAQHLAEWILQLFTIDWAPESKKERELLDELLAGQFEHQREYLRIQRQNFIEPDEFEMMPGIFRRLHEIRMTVQSGKA